MKKLINIFYLLSIISGFAFLYSLMTENSIEWRSAGYAVTLLSCAIYLHKQQLLKKAN
ncbi:hypothetical protein JFL43_12910 [Viridibacillus sp. YIM B01967]|uniref:Uncharacterized protein n=1 Tax=Viridibacillus soli TaxID=2798301 RepID=A0ABS1H9P3_9BACL|nr:hypothetical protein [Viridibacillus soli]MBK3495738.1 hypothetical protein [Viridibacillus soli]